MSTSLETYLHDHLAGAAFAINLLDALSRKHASDPFSTQLRGLLVEIQSDRNELETIAKKSGIEPGGMKEGVARFLEKLSRPKLVSSAEDFFSSFEACETLALGILGKAALWDALAVAVRLEVDQVDLKRLRKRAEEQHAVVEKLRLDLATIAFSPSKPGS